MRWLLTTVVLLTSTACASAPVARDFDDVSDYRAVSFTEAWDAVVDMSADQNWAIDILDRDSGLISTEWTIADNAAHIDCGAPGFRATHIDPMGRFDVVVRETDNGASLTVTTSWRVTRNSANSLGGVECLSTGVLERELHDGVRRRLR
jgi:hypothetical protein